MENRQSEKTGKFISEMRKLQKLTQKDLAEKLDVSDKAISKWERGLSCPDISLLIPLARILDVTASELLNGEKSAVSPPEPTEAVVEEALQYSKRNTAEKIGRIKEVSFAVFTLSCLIAIITCMICDFAVTGSLGWSLIVIISLLFSWLVLLPIWKAKNKAILKSLVLLSITVFPYLAALGHILKVPLVFRMGAGITVVSLAALWCFYAAALKLRSRKLCAAGVFFLLAIPVSLGINQIVNFFTRQAGNPAQDMLNAASALIMAVICFGGDYYVHHRKNI